MLQSTTRQILSKRLTSTRPSARFYTTAGISSSESSQEIRTRLLTELKSAMKNKNTMASTTIRSVLTEIYAADKLKSTQIPSSSIIPILRKAAQRRAENAEQFNAAARPDLAQTELAEQEFLSTFLPPLLSQPSIDETLLSVISELKDKNGGTVPGIEGLKEAQGGEVDINKLKKKSLAAVFALFYSRVDRNVVDSKLVSRRAEVLLFDS